MNIRIYKLLKMNNYEQLVEKSMNGTIFHTKNYLLTKGVNNVLCIYNKEEIFAIFPLYENSERKYQQLPMETPYGRIVVVKELHNRHDYEYLREIYKLIIEYLKDNYIQIDFSIIPINLDVFPFINENFIPEVRYTYIMDLTMSIEKIFLKMSSNRRRDYKKSFKENFIININNADLEISKILFWVNDSYLKNRLEEEMKLLIDKKKGALLNIYNKNYGIIGQLFLCWDWKCAYVQNVYVDKEYAKFGISTRLYIEAILYAKEILKVKKFDFNGSVLAGVENYYRTFGGEQQLYFNLHWMENHSELLKVDYYDYR